MADRTLRCLSFGPNEGNIMFSVTFACARRTGAAARQAFERMHNTLSHRVKTVLGTPWYFEHVAFCVHELSSQLLG
jgi:hypothetical protein